MVTESESTTSIELLKINPFEELIWDEGNPESQRLVNFAKTQLEEIKNVIYGRVFAVENKHSLNLEAVEKYQKNCNIKPLILLQKANPVYFEFTCAKQNFAEEQVTELMLFIIKEFKSHLPQCSKKARITIIENCIDYVCNAYLREKVGITSDYS